MLSSCNISGKEYTLDFERVAKRKTIYYHGVLYINDPIEFVCKVINADHIVFTPFKTDKDIAEAIINSIFLTRGTS